MTPSWINKLPPAPGFYWFMEDVNHPEIIKPIEVDGDGTGCYWEIGRDVPMWNIGVGGLVWSEPIARITALPQTTASHSPSTSPPTEA